MLGNQQSPGVILNNRVVTGHHVTPLLVGKTEVHHVYRKFRTCLERGERHPPASRLRCALSAEPQRTVDSASWIQLEQDSRLSVQSRAPVAENTVIAQGW